MVVFYLYSTMATATIGQMQEFNPDTKSIRAYLERFKLFIAVNDIAEDKQGSTLLGPDPSTKVVPYF